MTDFNQGVAMTTSLENRMESLVKANASRSAVCRLKAQFAARSPAVSTSRSAPAALQYAALVLTEEFGLLGFMRVHSFLEAIPGVGEVKVRTILKRVGVWPLRRIDGLTDRERRAIADELERLAGRGPARR